MFQTFHRHYIIVKKKKSEFRTFRINSNSAKPEIDIKNLCR